MDRRSARPRVSRNLRAFLALLCAATAVVVVLAGGCGKDDLVFPGSKGTPTETGTVTGTVTVTDTPTPSGTLTDTPQGTTTPTPHTTTTPIVVPTHCSQSGQPCLEPALKCCTGICLPAPLSVCLG